MRLFEKTDLKKQMHSEDYRLLSLSLGGALDKWYYPNDNLVIKEAKFLSDALKYQSHIVERLGSQLCGWLGIQSVYQDVCEILNEDGSKISASYCKDYRSAGEEYLDMTCLLADAGHDINEFSSLTGIAKIAKVESIIEMMGFPNADIYIENMCLIDFLLLNPDRHTGNYGILNDTANNSTKLVPLFDFGMGLKAYDTISLTAKVDALNEFAFVSPFAISLKDALTRYKSNWIKTIEQLPHKTVMLQSMEGLSQSRQDLFFQMLTMIAG